MRLLWLNINSSYSHSSLALPYIHSQSVRTENSIVQNSNSTDWFVLDGVINSDPGILASEAVSFKPDIITSTVWVFNHDMQVKVLSRIKALVPEVIIILGGPEFLGDNEQWLRTNRFANLVLRGEGEEVFPRWLDLWHLPDKWETLPGLCFIRPDGSYHDGGRAVVKDFAALSPPESSDFFDFSKPFVQFETSRGCFNTCGFCVSGIKDPVRNTAIEIVSDRLISIRSRGIKEIRILDRTFNSNPVRACSLLKLFREEFPDIRFHIEVHPGLITDELKQAIKDAPVGNLHIEAGIQSLRADVLEKSGRKGDLKLCLDGLSFLGQQDNVETHADLIAGLPGYKLQELYEDIYTLASFGVAEIQLELLKVLPGTIMREKAKDLELVYSPYPPYEVLKTDSISPDELQVARKYSKILDMFYNTKTFRNITTSLFLESPNSLLLLLKYLDTKNIFDKPVSIELRGRLLYGFCKAYFPDLCTNVTLAWIKAGLSIHKEPGGMIKIHKGNLPEDIPNGKDTKWFVLRDGSRLWYIGYNRAFKLSEPVHIIEKPCMSDNNNKQCLNPTSPDFDEGIR